MAGKRYPNTGALFRNPNKRLPTHPEYRGQADLDCPHCGAQIEVWLNGWVKSGSKGGRFLSIAIRSKNEEQRRGGADSSANREPQREPTRQPTQRPDDDEIPF